MQKDLNSPSNNLLLAPRENIQNEDYDNQDTESCIDLDELKAEVDKAYASINRPPLQLTIKQEFDKVKQDQESNLIDENGGLVFPSLGDLKESPELPQLELKEKQRSEKVEEVLELGQQRRKKSLKDSGRSSSEETISQKKLVSFNQPPLKKATSEAPQFKPRGSVLAPPLTTLKFQSGNNKFGSPHHQLETIPQEKNEDEEDQKSARSSIYPRSSKGTRTIKGHRTLVRGSSMTIPQGKEAQPKKKTYDRQDIINKTNRLMTKLREQVQDMLQRKDEPEIKKIFDEAEELGIPKKYNSFTNSYQHGLPLIFYMKRKEFERSYQAFLILVRRGFLNQAYQLSYHESFMRSNHYYIKKMKVFEEFFKKNDFFFPQKLLQNHSPQNVKLNVNSDDGSYNQHNYGYSIAKDYLFYFVKKIFQIQGHDIFTKNYRVVTENPDQSQMGQIMHPNDVSNHYDIEEKMKRKKTAEKMGELSRKLQFGIQQILNREQKVQGNYNDQDVSSQMNGSEKLQKQQTDKGKLSKKSGSQQKTTPILPAIEQQSRQNNRTIGGNTTSHGGASTLNPLNVEENIFALEQADSNNESFYNKQVLLNIVKGGFFNKDEKSIALALYLLRQEKKSANAEIIKLILQQYEGVSEFFGDVDIKDYAALKDKMQDPKCLGRIVKESLAMNEPEIAIFASKELIAANNNVLQVNMFPYKTFFEKLCGVLIDCRQGFHQQNSESSRVGQQKISLEEKAIQDDDKMRQEEERKKEILQRNTELKDRSRLMEIKQNIRTLVQLLTFLIQNDTYVYPQDIFRRTKGSYNESMDIRKASSNFILEGNEEYAGISKTDLKKITFKVILEQTREIKQSLQSQRFSKLQEEYLFKKLLKWELKNELLIHFGETDINQYFFNVMKLCIDYGKSFLAELILKNRKEAPQLKDEQCIMLFKSLLNRADGEKLELFLEILKWQKSAKKVLSKHIYHLIVGSQQLSGDDKSQFGPKDKKYLLNKGNCIYYCAEILSLTDVKEIENNYYAKEVTQSILKFCKSNELQYCHSPYLSLLLLAEFLSNLEKADVLHQNIIMNTKETVLELTRALQKSVKAEKKFKYMLQMKDLRDREALDIIVENNFYILLQNDEIGMIAEDLWTGPPAISIFNCGVLSQFVFLEIFDDQVDLFKNMQKDQDYIFQFDNWRNSCQHRYIMEAVSICSLAFFYLVIVYVAIQNNTLDSISQDETIVACQRMAQTWIISTFLSQLLQVIYSVQTKKKFQIDHWRILDFFLFIMTIIEILNIHDEIFPQEHDDIYPDNSYWRHLLNASIISLIVFLIWIRIISVLITTKRLGHMIQAISFMIQMTLNFLLIFACFLVCCTSIFTAIFYDDPVTTSYKSFSVTLTTLFSASLAVYDNQFGKLQPLGSIMVSVYVVISAVIFINLLIALLTQAFSQISKEADSRHRAILINYRHRWAWDSCHSYLIFTPPPFNILAFLIVPFGLTLPKRCLLVLNTFYCKLMFLMIYALPMIVMFFIYNLLLLPFAWLKGFSTLRSLLFSKRPIINLFLWLLFGLCVLVYVIFKDIANIIAISFESVAIGGKNKNQKFKQRLQHHKKKYDQERLIYRNFIKAVTELFDEVESLGQQNESVIATTAANSNESPSKRPLRQTSRTSLSLRTIPSKTDKPQGEVTQKNGIDIKLCTSRFYRLLEDREEHWRNIQNPAHALKGKRKRRPKIIGSLMIEYDYFQQGNPGIKHEQIYLLQCYFHKKAFYPEHLIFERAYYADFTAIDKAIHKFKQKTALQKKGQNLKKITETSAILRENIQDFNEQTNLTFLADKITQFMEEKVEEARERLRLTKLGNQVNDDQDQSNGDGEDYEDSFDENTQSSQTDTDQEDEDDDNEDQSELMPDKKGDPNNNDNANEDYQEMPQLNLLSLNKHGSFQETVPQTLMDKKKSLFSKKKQQ